MKYIVTKDDLKVRGYTVVKSMKGIDLTNCECLIFNNSEDSNVEDLLILSKLKDKSIKCIYITEEMDPLYSIAFSGLQGVIVKQSSSSQLVHDKEVLDYLVKTYKSSSMGTKTASQEFESLVECIRVLSEEKDTKELQHIITNNIWQKNLQAKLANVDVALARASEKDGAVLNLLSKLSAMLDDVNKSNEETAYQLNALQKTVNEMQTSGGKNSLNFFSKYSVSPSIKHALYIKEESTCPFLRAFMFSYMRHVKRVKELNFKMLLIMPKLKNMMEKYKELPKLSPDSIKLVTVESSELYVTFEPTKAVMDKFFSSKNDGYIVVDCSYGTELLTGPTVTKLHAISSVKDIERLKLKESKCIMSMTDMGDNIMIPFFNEYVTQKNDASKVSLYVLHCQEQYEKIDKMLNLMQ